MDILLHATLVENYFQQGSRRSASVSSSKFLFRDRVYIDCCRFVVILPACVSGLFLKRYQHSESVNCVMLA